MHSRDYLLQLGINKRVMNKAPRIDLNPSSADRWTTCTASPSFLFEHADKVQEQDTVYNQEGTTAHEVAAAFLQNRKPDEQNKWCCPVPIDAEMRWHAWNYAEFVTGLRKPGSTLLVEKKIPLFYMPARNAKVDAVVLNPNELHVIDFKYGEGIVVSPEQSLQAVIYAKCVIAAEKMTLGIDYPIFIHIYQPRGRAASNAPFHTWETTWGEIAEITSRIFDVADRILAQVYPVDGAADFDLQFSPSEKACQWCPAKGFCTERSRLLTDGIESLSNINTEPAKTLPPANTVSIEQLSKILKHGDNITKWIKDAQEYALACMKAGKKIPGFKLVTSRGGNRYWTNPVKAGKLLVANTILKPDEVYETNTIGPAAAEKLLGKARFSAELVNLISKPPGQPVIAPADDTREECLIDGKSEFFSLDQF